MSLCSYEYVGQTHDLRVSPELLNSSLTGKPNSTRPLNRISRSLLGNDRRVVLGHSSLLGKVRPFFLTIGRADCGK